MKRLSILLFTVGLITSEIALGQDTDKCAPRTIHQEIYPGESSKEVAAAMRTAVTLWSKWEDSRILAAFGFTKAVADRDTVHGVDGRQLSYHVGKTKVTIVRSYSSGMVVTVSNGRYAGAWLVDRCD